MARDLRRYLAGCSSLNRCSCCGAGVGPPSLRRQRAQVISARVGSSAVGDHPATPVWHRSSGACSSPIQWPRLTACTVRPARTTAWTPGSPNTARVEAASGAMSVMCPTIRAASDTAACRQVGRSDGADDEGFAGGVDDFVGDGVELVDVHDSVDLRHEAGGEPEVAAGDADPVRSRWSRSASRLGVVSRSASSMMTSSVQRRDGE